MKGAGASVDKLLNEGRKSCASGPFGAQTLYLLSSGDFSSQQEPEETFGKGFRSSRGFW